jgi:hypothetical protein
MSTEQEEFEFLLQMEKEAKQGIPPPNPAPVTTGQAKASTMDMVLGSAPARVAMGAASPFVGAAQLGANVGSKMSPYLPGYEEGQLDVGQWVNKKLGEIEASKQRGMAARGNEGYDWLGLLGSMGSGGVIGKEMGAMLPAAKGLFGRMGVGAAQGAAAGGTQPVMNAQDDFGTQKAIQTGTGSLIGGAIPALAAGVQGISKFVSPITDLFRGQRGIEDLARKGYEKNIGASQMEAARDALLQTRQPVAGYKPTAAEALAHTPEGSPIQALQRITARTEGGPSAAFGERLLKQRGAIDIAKRARNAMTGPMREEALSLANQGGVEARDVLEGIAGIRARPDLGASDVVSKTLDHLSSKIESLTDKAGKINADALYTVRKELGNTIGRYAEETQNWDKRLSAGIQSDIQKGMDWAINNSIRRASPTQIGEEAAGTGQTIWDKYLAEHASRSQAIADVMATKKLSLKPTQPTTLGASKEIATGGMPHLALLSRPVVIANALLSHLGKTNIEPKIDALNQQLLLNPQRLGQFLGPQAPSRNQAMIDELMRQMPAAAAAGAGRQF